MDGITFAELTSSTIRAGNFDGDVATDLLIMSPTINGSKAIRIELRGTTLQPYLTNVYPSMTTFAYPDERFYTQQGDFNGDGKTDLLTSKGNGTWEVAYFEGGDFKKYGFNFIDGLQPYLTYDGQNNSLELARDQQLFLDDYNNDGLTDVMCIAQKRTCQKLGFLTSCSYQDNYNLTIYYSTGYSFVSETIVSDLDKDPLLGYRLIFGDFNADAIPDILSTATPDDIMELKYINKGAEDFLMKSVLDGFNNKVTFDYKSMADPDIYTKTTDPIVNNYSYPLATGQSPASFPLNKVTFRERLVSQMYTPNGLSTGENVISYQYKDAVYHREGKGLLGFLEKSSTDTNQNRRSVAKAGVNKTYYSIFPISSHTYVSSNDELIAESFQDISFVDKNNLRYWLRGDNSYSFDFINQRRSVDQLTYDSNGNVLTQWNFIEGLDLQQIETRLTVYSDYVSNGSYIPYLPGSVTTQKDRQGDDPFSLTATYEYDALGTMMERRNYAGLPQEVLTTYTGVDGFGHPTLTTISAVNGDIESRSSSIDYDNEGRFILTAYNALNQPSTATYDRKWGSPLSVTTVDANLTSITYDHFGRNEDVTTPAGYSIGTDFLWDIRGGTGADLNNAADAVYYTESIHPAAPNSKTYYNSLSRPRLTTTQDFKYGDGEFFETSVEQLYDLRGRVIKATNPFRGNHDPALVSDYAYDEYNRALTVQSPTGTSSYVYNTSTNGELEVVHTLEDGLTIKNSTDASGKQIKSSDTGGGLMTYDYYSHGRPKSVLVDGVEVSNMTYDVHARQIALWEVNSGITTYGYNSFGELISQDDSRPTVIPTTVAYDVLGRVDFVDQQEGHIEYSYHPSGNGLNQVSEVVNYNGYTEIYTYDVLDRLSTHTEMINGETFNHQYTYTDFDQLRSMTCPSGLQITYDYYDGTGFLRRILDHTTILDGSGNITQAGHVIYEPKASNVYGQMTEYTLGNGLTTSVAYDPFGILDRISTVGTPIFDMTFDFNIQNGLLNSRTDGVKGLSESFMYDSHYRLETVTKDNVTSLSMSYDANGNIINKSDISSDDYLYESDKIHAVTKIPAPGEIGTRDQSVTYNSSHQPTSITDGSNVLNLENGSDEQRRYTVLTDGGNVVTERYFSGNYEKEISGGVSREIHYLEAGIIVVRENGGSYQYFYTYGDYLGSILAVTDDTGAEVARQSFDVWGRKRNAEDWTFTGVSDLDLPWLYRGYTSHEMLPQLDLVNMNGRLYDPKIARMLSVDNFAGHEGSSQGYNRYSYVMNNPLMYTDPTGEDPLVCSTECSTAGQKGLSNAGSFLGWGAGQFLSFDSDYSFDVGGGNPDPEPKKLTFGERALLGFMAFLDWRGSVETGERVFDPENTDASLEDLERNLQAGMDGLFFDAQMFMIWRGATRPGGSSRTNRNNSSNPKPTGVSSPNKVTIPISQNSTPGSVQSRINIANFTTRFTPIRPSTGQPVSAGWSHVLNGHFNREISNNRSIFTITPDRLKVILQSKTVVKSPVSKIDGGQFVRTVDVCDNVGISSCKQGGTPTSWIKVFTDSKGNLITTYPVATP